MKTTGHLQRKAETGKLSEHREVPLRGPAEIFASSMNTARQLHPRVSMVVELQMGTVSHGIWHSLCTTVTKGLSEGFMVVVQKRKLSVGRKSLSNGI